MNQHENLQPGTRVIAGKFEENQYTTFLDFKEEYVGKEATVVELDDSSTRISFGGDATFWWLTSALTPVEEVITESKKLDNLNNAFAVLEQSEALVEYAQNEIGKAAIEYAEKNCTNVSPNSHAKSYCEKDFMAGAEWTVNFLLNAKP